MATEDESEAQRPSPQPGGQGDPSITRRTARRSPRPRTVPVVLETIESAAEKLGMDPEALRARCRRAAVRVKGETIARLGAGVVAMKFGRTWRVRFDTIP